MLFQCALLLVAATAVAAFERFSHRRRRDWKVTRKVNLRKYVGRSLLIKSERRHILEYILLPWGVSNNIAIVLLAKFETLDFPPWLGIPEIDLCGLKWKKKKPNPSTARFHLSAMPEGLTSFHWNSVCTNHFSENEPMRPEDIHQDRLYQDCTWTPVVYMYLQQDFLLL